MKSKKLIWVEVSLPSHYIMEYYRMEKEFKDTNAWERCISMALAKHLFYYRNNIQEGIKSCNKFDMIKQKPVSLRNHLFIVPVDETLMHLAGKYYNAREFLSIAIKKYIFEKSYEKLLTEYEELTKCLDKPKKHLLAKETN